MRLELKNADYDEHPIYFQQTYRESLYFRIANDSNSQRIKDQTPPNRNSMNAISTIIGIFGAQSTFATNAEPQEFHIVDLNLIPNESGHELSFAALDKKFDLRLTAVTERLITKNANNGNMKDHPLLEKCEFFRGHDINDEHIRFSISHCEDRGFDGHIYSPKDGVFEIHPLVGKHHILKKHNTVHGEHSDPVKMPFTEEEARRMMSQAELQQQVGNVSCTDRLIHDKCAMIEFSHLSMFF